MWHRLPDQALYLSRTHGLVACATKETEGAEMIRVMLMLSVLLAIGCEKEIREACTPADLDHTAVAQMQAE